MEILNLLEERVLALMQEVERIREDNLRIIQESDERVAKLQNDIKDLKDEKESLQDLFDQEQQAKNDIMQRINGLLELLKTSG